LSKILLTGGTGYIGSHLCKKFINDQNNIAVIKRKSSKIESLKEIYDRLTVFNYNNDYSSINSAISSFKPDIVIHLASYQVYNHESKDINKIMDCNIALGMYLLESMKENKIKYLINTETFWQNYNDEPYNPVCLYAASKKAFKDLLRYYTEIKMIKSISLKLFDTFGSNDLRKKIFYQINDHILRKKDVMDMSFGEQLINIVHIDDVVEAYKTSIERFAKFEDIYLEDFDIRSNENIKLKTLVNTYLRFIDNQIKINWGGRSYRDREIMIPAFMGKILPGWSPKVKLEDGLKSLANEFLKVQFEHNN
tara:strand:+ start:6880 stop:7803 length:924 start_codon:yes stop_codon:yes gene_type:complete